MIHVFKNIIRKDTNPKIKNKQKQVDVIVYQIFTGLCYLLHIALKPITLSTLDPGTMGILGALTPPVENLHITCDSTQT